METTIKDGVISTLTPYGLEMVTNATLYNVYNVVRTKRGKVIYKKEHTLFNAQPDMVATLHQSALNDFLALAINADLRKPLNF